MKVDKAILLCDLLHLEIGFYYYSTAGVSMKNNQEGCGYPMNILTRDEDVSWSPAADNPRLRAENIGHFSGHVFLN
jgi:hypothetical protein